MSVGHIPRTIQKLWLRQSKGVWAGLHERASHAIGDADIGPELIRTAPCPSFFAALSTSHTIAQPISHKSHPPPTRPPAGIDVPVLRMTASARGFQRCIAHVQRMFTPTCMRMSMRMSTHGSIDIPEIFESSSPPFFSSRSTPIFFASSTLVGTVVTSPPFHPAMTI